MAIWENRAKWLGRHSPRVAAVLALAVAAIAKGQNNLQTIGLTELLNLDPTLTGAGITVGQPEADLDGSGSNTFEVNPAQVIQPASKFTYYDDNGNVTTVFNPAYESGHADNVGNYFYGTGQGVAPGVAAVDNYSADYFANSIINNLLSIPDTVVNQSFIFNESPNVPLTVGDQQSIDTIYDNYIAMFGTIIVSAVGNSGPFPNVNAPGTAYNGIGVAADPGPASVGPTIDNGRSKPDIIAPGDATSYTTPLVAGSATILVQAGQRGDGGTSPQTEADAVDARTVKALLLNGADKQLVNFSRTPIAPLDPVDGSGMLNVYNSYEQLVGGQHSASLLSNTSGVGQAHPPAISTFNSNSSAGWDFSTLTTTSSSDQYANYNFKASQNSLTATLVWERQFNNNPNVPLGINNLDLFLYDTTDGLLIDYSTSIVDNVQDVYDTNLIPGDTYDLEVLKVGGTAGVSPAVISNTETYALAYNFAAAQTGAIPSGVWNAAGGGSWSDAASWFNSIIPNQAHDTANFTNALAGPETITLDGTWIVGHLNFLSTNSYTIAPGSGGTLVLDNTGADETASVVDSGGTHFITAPVALNDDTLITVVNAADLLTFSGGISGTANLFTAGAGTVDLAATDSYTSGTTVRSGTLLVSSPVGLPSGRNVVNNATLSIQTGTSNQAAVIGTLSGSGSLVIGNNSVAGYARLQAGSGVCAQGALTINPGSTLDITDNPLEINFPAGDDPAAAIRAYLQSGYGNDTWSGPGINSSSAAVNPGLLAVGYADGNTDAGTPAAADQIFIETTIAGDANLDGLVNFSDLLVVAQDYGRTGQDWAEGDFNYDSLVNFSDLLLVAQNYGKQLSAGELAQLPGSFAAQWQLAKAEVQAGQSSNVPEPASAGLLAMSAAGLLARRRRRAQDL